MSARWLGFAGAVVLSSAALFAAERPNILVVPAHPDDFQGCAGTCLLLRHKYDIHVCDLTAGEAGLGKEGYLNGETKRIRYAEETNALAVVGAKLYYTGEINACDPGDPDNAAHAGRRACETIANLIRKLKPKAVFTHWPIDHHGDHTMAATATMKAIAMSGENPEVYYFEAWDWEMSQFVPTHFIDISSVSGLRDEYIRRHRSQGPEWMETMNRTMSSWRGQRLMTPRVDQAELLGVRTPVPYGTPSVLDDIRTSPYLRH